MERKGYDESFDKQTAMDKMSPEELVMQDTVEELAHKRTQAFSNLIEFVVGAILLGFCWYYLQTHPAEKVSLFSGVEMMWDKVQMWFSGTPEEEKNLINQKTSLEKTMQEIVLLSKENICLDEPTKTSIEATFARIKKMGSEEYAKQQNTLNTLVGLYYTKVREACE